MDIAHQALVLLHLIGFACLLGGLLVQTRSSSPEVNGAMVTGAWLELITGAGLVALIVLSAQRIEYAQLGVKLAVTLFVVLLVTKNRKFESIPRGLWALISAMTLANTVIAVVW
jgi:hypothetical protein